MAKEKPAEIKVKAFGPLHAFVGADPHGAHAHVAGRFEVSARITLDRIS